MPENTTTPPGTPPRKTAENILASSLSGVMLTPAHQERIQEKAEIELRTAQNHHKRLRDESPYTKNHAIGETHQHVAPKRYLIEQMPKYARQGYTTLFVEHLLYDDHKADLEAFNASGRMSPALLEYLIRQNKGHMDEQDNGVHNYTGVLKAAQIHHIRVVALDTSLSYSFDSGKQRALAFSLTASEIINREAREDKWLAFMGNAHNHLQYFDDDTFVPGIANLLPNTVAINIFDRSQYADPSPLTIERNAERKIGEKTIYADIAITASDSNSLDFDLAEVEALKSPKSSFVERIWSQRTEEALVKDTLPCSTTPPSDEGPSHDAKRKLNF